MFLPIIANEDDFNKYVKIIKNMFGDKSVMIEFIHLKDEDKFYDFHINIIKDHDEVNMYKPNILYLIDIDNVDDQSSLICDINCFYVDFKTGLSCETPIIYISDIMRDHFNNSDVIQISLDSISYKIIISNFGIFSNWSYHNGKMCIKKDKFIFEINCNSNRYQYRITARNNGFVLNDYHSDQISTSKYIDILIDELVKYLNGHMETLSQKEIIEVDEGILMCLKIQELDKYLECMKNEGKKIKIYGGLAMIYSDMHDINKIYKNIDIIKKLINAGSAIKGIELSDELKKYFIIENYSKKWSLCYNIKYHKRYSSYKDELTLNIICMSNIEYLSKLLIPDTDIFDE